MAKIECRWFDEQQRILLVDIIDCTQWTWDEAYETIARQVAMMQTVKHEVHTIFHFQSPPKFTTRGLVKNLGNLMNTHADNEGLSIFIGTSHLFNYILETTGKLTANNWLLGKYRFVHTQEEALREINKYNAQSKGYNGLVRR